MKKLLITIALLTSFTTYADKPSEYTPVGPYEPARMPFCGVININNSQTGDGEFTKACGLSMNSCVVALNNRAAAIQAQNPNLIVSTRPCMPN